MGVDPAATVRSFSLFIIFGTSMLCGRSKCGSRLKLERWDASTCCPVTNQDTGRTRFIPVEVRAWRGERDRGSQLCVGPRDGSIDLRLGRCRRQDRENDFRVCDGLLVKGRGGMVYFPAGTANHSSDPLRRSGKMQGLRSRPFLIVVR